MRIPKEKLHMLQDDSITPLEPDDPLLHTKESQLIHQKVMLDFGDISKAEYYENVARIEKEFADRE